MRKLLLLIIVCIGVTARAEVHIQNFNVYIPQNAIPEGEQKETWASENERWKTWEAYHWEEDIQEIKLEEEDKEDKEDSTESQKSDDTEDQTPQYQRNPRKQEES